MQLKKLLQGGTFALVVAACAIAVPTVAHAEGETAAKAGSFEKALVDNVMIDGNDGTLYASTEAQELLVGIAKVNKSGKATVASWASYEMSNAVAEDEDSPALLKVDLSKLSSSKDNYIALKGSGAESIAIIKIQASTQKNIKAKFDATSGLQAGEGTPAAISNDKYIYRTQYGRWSNLWDSEAADGKGAVVSLAMYQEEGAKLFVRAAGTEIGIGEDYDENHTLAQGSTTVKYDGITDVVLYESKTAPLPSNEAKVTIPAKAKGPKVAINYLKGTVKIPNDTEWRLVTDESIKYDTAGAPFTETGEKTVTEILGKLTPATGSANDSKAQLLAATKTPTPTATPEPEPEVTAESVTLEVRKKQNGKKLASKWTPVEISEAKGFDEGKLIAGTDVNLGFQANEDGTIGTDPIEEGTPVAADYKKDLEVKYGGAGIKDAKLLEGEGTTSVLSIDYVAADKKATKYNVEIKNGGKVSYEFVVKAKDSAAASITDSDKVYIAKANNKNKVVLKNLTDGQVVFVRTAGDKSTKSWVGAYELLGSIDLPKVVIGTKPDPTPTPTPGA